MKHISFDDDITLFQACSVGCVVKTHDNKILLRERGQDWIDCPNHLSVFGGNIGENENHHIAIVRELQEELGADPQFEEVVYLGAIIGRQNVLMFTYFWYDEYNTIKKCFEGTPRYFERAHLIEEHPFIMPDVRWIIKRCIELNLF